VTDILTIGRVSKRFGAVAALLDVSLSIRKGEVRAICGENGAGKSTLVRIVMGMQPSDAGTISIDGAPRQIRSPSDAQALGLAQ